MILRLKVYRLLLKVGIYSLSFLASYLGWWVWRGICELLGRPAVYSIRGHADEILFGAFVWALLSEHYKVTAFDELFLERTRARAALYACLATSFVLLATLYFSRNVLFPRGLLVCNVAAIFVLTVLLQLGFLILFRSHADMAKPSIVLVVGADEFARDAARRLQRLSFAPCQIAGFVRLPGQAVQVGGRRVYELGQLDLLTPSHGLDEAVIAVHPAQFSILPKLIKSLEHLCLPIRAVVDLGEGVVVREKLYQLGDIQMLDLNSTPADSLAYALLKRGFDICFSAAFLLVTAPLLGLVALIIRLTSPGPIFFVQERVGLNGKLFHMYKFRTMRATPGAGSDTTHTSAEDPRRTPFGAFLRRTSLDELPQFINVLKGDMSIVGPRPEMTHFVHKFLREVDRYNHRHALKVGITGWAQVNGWRGNTSIEKRIEYDLYYLQHWSFALDLRIILMTLFSGLINKNAY
jgi:Undecaprenyl-phosphate glucose phosphotransferase